jgi:hypothetical protein
VLTSCLLLLPLLPSPPPLKTLERALVLGIQQKLQALDLWYGPFVMVRDQLRVAVNVTQRWSSMVADLTGRFWPSHARRPWTLGKMTGDARHASGCQA